MRIMPDVLADLLKPEVAATAQCCMLDLGLRPPQHKASGIIGTIFAKGVQPRTSIANQTPCSPRGKDGTEDIYYTCDATQPEHLRHSALEPCAACCPPR